MDELKEQIWKEVIIDHGQFPRRHGRIENYSHQGEGENPFCGDRVSLQILVNEAGVIKDIAYEATGCAISLSSGSLLTASLAGKSLVQAQQIFRSVHGLLTGNPVTEGEDLGELEALNLVRRYPARVKCASLVWHVLRNALDGDTDTATTE
jgi:nitrogen fixation NifU-like protein